MLMVSDIPISICLLAVLIGMQNDYLTNFSSSVTQHDGLPGLFCPRKNCIVYQLKNKEM